MIFYKRVDDSTILFTRKEKKNIVEDRENE